MTSTLRLSLIAAAAASALLAGCASSGNSVGGTGTVGGAATGAAAPTPAAAAPVAAPAPVAPPRLPGLDYAAIRDAADETSAVKIRKALVGETVSVELARASGRGVPAGAYAVDAEDGIFFRCATSERGFKGGTVTAKVRSVHVTTKPKHRVLELDRCAEVAVAAPVSAPPPARAAAPAPAPVAAAPAPVASSSAKGSGTRGAGKPGMDANGNVVDSTKVESGSGITVKGINDYEGEITGNPAANSKFTRLQIGMPVRQVTDLIGPPTDQGAYMTGKAWIPFYFGGDRHRFEMTYKGQGRLIFAGGGMGDFTSGYLIWIIHNSSEPGYR